ncbi:chorismate mutase [Methanosalsum zhilinae DSM 4017]|uniref:Chorismate mutase n=1 Tax=Methanosalsum zhilinae (strain DSM 4017 / NBRC 107636 / OCM 62 / WeN5) TaxID=679901 RepID=F7XN08_METZD|nr:chorismate mutase [Methanosalsum zhilinae]AEH61117.1 chorismate mutase [Methanosalsum zhilinae DSM 4017]
MNQLNEAREEIHDIDTEIISLIKRRVDMADKILRFKKEEGISINDESQNEVVLRRATDIATELNLDSGAVRKIFKILIQMNIDRQHELSGEGNLP